MPTILHWPMLGNQQQLLYFVIIHALNSVLGTVVKAKIIVICGNDSCLQICTDQGCEIKYNHRNNFTGLCRL